MCESLNARNERCVVSCVEKAMNFFFLDVKSNIKAVVFVR